MAKEINLEGYIKSIKEDHYIPGATKRYLIGGAYRLFGVDPKTKIPNSEFLSGRLSELIAQSQRQPVSDLSIAVHDLDRFGRYNKKPYSVALGDRVIRAFARTCRDGMRRKIDFAARYGGDEMVTVHPKSPKYVAAEIAEIIRRNMEHLKFEYHNSAENRTEQLGVTVSCGVGSVGDVDQIRILHSRDGNRLLIGFLDGQYADIIRQFSQRTGIRDEKLDFHLGELREMARHFLEENDLNGAMTPREALVNSDFSNALRSYMSVESFIGEVDRRGLQKAKSEGGNRVIILQ